MKQFLFVIALLSLALPEARAEKGWCVTCYSQLVMGITVIKTKGKTPELAEEVCRTSYNGIPVWGSGVRCELSNTPNASTGG